jgi:hypothetical protein
MNEMPPFPPHSGEQDDLWRLLGKAPLAQPDAWFTVRTLARCRYESLEAVAPVTNPLAHIWRWALGSGLGAALAVFLIVSHLSSSPTVTRQQQAQEAFEVMATLDTDTDTSSTSSSSTWQDSTSL